MGQAEARGLKKDPLRSSDCGFFGAVVGAETVLCLRKYTDASIVVVKLGMRKLVYYVATSIDGYIADDSGDPSVFPAQPQTLADLFSRYPETCPRHLHQPLGVTGSPRRFDTVIMGYRTHEAALKAGLSSAYPHLRQIVATHRELPDDPSVEVWSGDLAPRIAELKHQAGGDIWLCGGGKLASQLIQHIDELQIKLNPITLGSGTPLFANAHLHSWRLKASKQLPGNVCLLSYESNRR